MSSFHQLFARKQDCTGVGADCPISKSFYGYAPSLIPNAILLALFSVALLAHGAQGVYYRAWSTLTAMGWGCICELLGYAGRLMMHNNPFYLNGFLIQICCLTIAPAFFSAAIYLSLARRHVSFNNGHIRTETDMNENSVVLFGTEVSRLSPKAYAYIFISCDIVSLALQGAGGALASIAAQSQKSLTMGDNVQLAGLAFQVGSLALFGACAGEYAWRVFRSPASSARARQVFAYNKGLLACFGALGLSYTAIMVRCVYRVIELSNGWGSTLMKNQIDFVALEGAMIVVAVISVNAVYPGKYLNRAIDPDFERKDAGSVGSQTEVASKHMF